MIARQNFATTLIGHGWAAPCAATVARVVYPFDDADQPHRKFARKVNNRAESFAGFMVDVARLEQRTSLHASLTCAEDYVELARSARPNVLHAPWLRLVDDLRFVVGLYG